MAVTIPFETTYDDSGVKEATSSVEAAGKELEAAGTQTANKYKAVGAAIGDAFRAGADGAFAAVGAAGMVIASGGSMSEAWDAASQELMRAAENMVASIAETAVAEHGMALASKAWAAAQWLVNAAMSANPIALIIIGIVALIAVIVILWKKSDTFRKIVTAAFEGFLSAVKAVWNWLKANWATLLTILLGPIAIAVRLIIANWDKIKAGARKVVDWLKTTWSNLTNTITKPFTAAWDILSGIFDKISGAIQNVLDLIGKIHVPHIDLNPFNNSAPAGPVTFASAPAGTYGYGRSVGGGSSSTTYNPSLTVYGAVDPEGTAREISRLLERHASRQGRTANVPLRRAW